jgi:hypothetical protein
MAGEVSGHSPRMARTNHGSAHVPRVASNYTRDNLSPLLSFVTPILNYDTAETPWRGGASFTFGILVVFELHLYAVRAYLIARRLQCKKS